MVQLLISPISQTNHVNDPYPLFDFTQISEAEFPQTPRA